MPRSFVGAETKAPVIKELMGISDDFQGFQLWHDYLRISREEYLRQCFDVRMTWKQCPLALRDRSRENLLRIFSTTAPFCEIEALAREDIADWGLRQAHYRARESFRKNEGPLRRPGSGSASVAGPSSARAEQTPAPASSSSDHQTSPTSPSSPTATRRVMLPPGSFDPITERYYPRTSTPSSRRTSLDGS